MTNFDLPGQYLEFGAVHRLSEQLAALENEQYYKLSKSIAYAFFILNIIAQKSKGKHGHPELRKLLCVPLTSDQVQKYFENPDFNGRDVTLHDCVEWLRNRLSHFDEPAPRGIRVEARSHGIRRFTIRGKISNHSSFGGAELVATMDRQRLTCFVKDISQIYECWAVKTNRVGEQETKLAAFNEADGAA